jgi:hypothetical protein
MRHCRRTSSSRMATLNSSAVPLCCPNTAPHGATHTNEHHPRPPTDKYNTRTSTPLHTEQNNEMHTQPHW